MKVVLFSGGIDSTTLLYEKAREGECLALGFDYGQAHVAELDNAEELAYGIGVEFTVQRFSDSMARILRTTAGVVYPNRNMTFIGLAGAVALTNGCDTVAIGCTGSDAELFPDCRAGFLTAAGMALHMATGVFLEYPYVGLTKAEVVERGRLLEVPYERTRSCYEAEECGLCLACVERAKALA